MPLSRRSLLLAALLTGPARAAAQPATPVDLDATLDGHVAWVVSLFDGGAADLAPADVEARFDANFRSLVPPGELIATIRQLAGQLGPITLVEERSTAPGEFVGIFRSESGDGVMISIAVDPDTGLIAGFFITPAALPAAASPVASPEATPVAAGPVRLDARSQIALYEEALAAIRSVGERAVAAVLARDDAALAPMLSKAVASEMRSLRIADVVDSYTTRQVQMTYAEAGARFFGQWSGDTIDGAMVQLGQTLPFTLTAATPQRAGLPDGAWSGTLSTIGLEFQVTFAADARGGLGATLDIPAQKVVDAELSDVRYDAERPIGALVDERTLGAGPRLDSYTVDHAWGDALLRVVVGVDVDTGEVTSLQVLPAAPLPAAPDTPALAGSYRLPFDGTWWVLWGGETELENYHAVSPSQRYAYDLLIWKDGATYHGDGGENAEYWAWSQPVLAPVDGEVVDALDGVTDLTPNQPPPASAVQNPVGNHVVIQVAEGEFVFVAHLQRGSVRVRRGDRVTAGDPLGLVGSTGNSSQPHVHIHAQTTPVVNDPGAVGIPLRFDDILVDGAPVRDAMPVQGRFVANR